MVQQVHESAVDAVAAERRRQDAKWGEQNHPDGTGPYEEPVAQILGDYIKAERAADLAKGATDLAAERGDVTWADILLEEVFEALAEKDPLRLRGELVQVSAVAQQWVESIDRQSGVRSTNEPGGSDTDPLTLQQRTATRLLTTVWDGAGLGPDSAAQHVPGHYSFACPLCRPDLDDNASRIVAVVLREALTEDALGHAAHVASRCSITHADTTAGHRDEARALRAQFTRKDDR